MLGSYRLSKAAIRRIERERRALMAALMATTEEYTWFRTAKKRPQAMRAKRRR